MAIGFTDLTSTVRKPDKGMTRSAKPSVHIMKFGDGYEQRLANGLNALKETFSIKLMLDSNEYPSLKKDATFGILPILAALEEMMEPTESVSKKTIPGHKYPPKFFPQVVFHWGENRALPVKIDGMTIDEKKYNNKLVPISAEVEVKMKFLIPELSPYMENDLKEAYEWTKKKGKSMAKKYYS